MKVSLYDIFEMEMKRNTDRNVSLFFNKNKNSISYINEQGTLTVVFRSEDGKNIIPPAEQENLKGAVTEQIFFKPCDAKGSDKKIVLNIAEHGRNATSPVLENGRKGIETLPEIFRQICLEYQYARDEIGLERPEEKKKHRDIGKDR